MRAGTMKGRFEAMEEREVACDRPRVNQRHQELGIVDLEPRKLLDLANLVADVQANVPQRMQEVGEEPFLARAEVAAEQHKEIDIQREAELSPAVAADRDHGDGLLASGGAGQELAQKSVEP